MLKIKNLHASVEGGKVKNNPDKDGWEKIVEIKEIIKVEKPTAEPAIKVKGE